MSQTLQIDRAASAVDRLRGAVRLQRLAEAEQLQAIADLAGEHDWTTTDELDVVGERAGRGRWDTAGGGVPAARGCGGDRDLGGIGDLADP